MDFADLSDEDIEVDHGIDEDDDLMAPVMATTSSTPKKKSKDKSKDKSKKKKGGSRSSKKSRGDKDDRASPSKRASPSRDKRRNNGSNPQKLSASDAFASGGVMSSGVGMGGLTAMGAGGVRGPGNKPPLAPSARGSSWTPGGGTGLNPIAGGMGGSGFGGSAGVGGGLGVGSGLGGAGPLPSFGQKTKVSVSGWSSDSGTDDRGPFPSTLEPSVELLQQSNRRMKHESDDDGDDQQRLLNALHGDQWMSDFGEDEDTDSDNENTKQENRRWGNNTKFGVGNANRPATRLGQTASTKTATGETAPRSEWGLFPENEPTDAGSETDSGMLVPAVSEGEGGDPRLAALERAYGSEAVRGPTDDGGTGSSSGSGSGSGNQASLGAGGRGSGRRFLGDSSDDAVDFQIADHDGEEMDEESGSDVDFDYASNNNNGSNNIPKGLSNVKFVSSVTEAGEMSSELDEMRVAMPTMPSLGTTTSSSAVTAATSKAPSTSFSIGGLSGVKFASDLDFDSDSDVVEDETTTAVADGLKPVASMDSAPSVGGMGVSVAPSMSMSTSVKPGQKPAAPLPGLSIGGLGNVMFASDLDFGDSDVGDDTPADVADEASDVRNDDSDHRSELDRMEAREREAEERERRLQEEEEEEENRLAMERLAARGHGFGSGVAGGAVVAGGGGNGIGNDSAESWERAAEAREEAQVRLREDRESRLLQQERQEEAEHFAERERMLQREAEQQAAAEAEERELAEALYVARAGYTSTDDERGAMGVGGGDSGTNESRLHAHAVGKGGSSPGEEQSPAHWHGQEQRKGDRRIFGIHEGDGKETGLGASGGAPGPNRDDDRMDMSRLLLSPPIPPDIAGRSPSPVILESRATDFYLQQGHGRGGVMDTTPSFNRTGPAASVSRPYMTPGGQSHLHMSFGSVGADSPLPHVQGHAGDVTSPILAAAETRVSGGGGQQQQQAPRAVAGQHQPFATDTAHAQAIAEARIEGASRFVSLAQAKHKKERQASERRAALEKLLVETLSLRPVADLDLGKLQLRRLPHGICRSGASCVAVLRLHGNRLDSLPAALRHMTTLTELNVDDNRVTYLPGQLYSLPKLTAISAARNHIKGLSPDVCAATSLTSLDLSHNHILALPPAIAHVPLLRRLLLDGNNIVSPPLWVVEKGASAVRKHFIACGLATRVSSRRVKQEQQQNKPISVTMPPPLPSFGRIGDPVTLSGLFMNDFLADVYIATSSSLLPAHLCVLAARCPSLLSPKRLKGPTLAERVTGTRTATGPSITATGGVPRVRVWEVNDAISAAAETALRKDKAPDTVVLDIGASHEAGVVLLWYLYTDLLATAKVLSEYDTPRSLPPHKARLSDLVTACAAVASADGVSVVDGPTGRGQRTPNTADDGNGEDNNGKDGKSSKGGAAAAELAKPTAASAGASANLATSTGGMLPATASYATAGLARRLDLNRLVDLCSLNYKGASSRWAQLMATTYIGDEPVLAKSTYAADIRRAFLAPLSVHTAVAPAMDSIDLGADTTASHSRDETRGGDGDEENENISDRINVRAATATTDTPRRNAAGACVDNTEKGRHELLAAIPRGDAVFVIDRCKVHVHAAMVAACGGALASALSPQPPPTRASNGEAHAVADGNDDNGAVRHESRVKQLHSHAQPLVVRMPSWCSEAALRASLAFLAGVPARKCVSVGTSASKSDIPAHTGGGHGADGTQSAGNVTGLAIPLLELTRGWLGIESVDLHEASIGVLLRTVTSQNVSSLLDLCEVWCWGACEMGATPGRRGGADSVARVGAGNVVLGALGGGGKQQRQGVALLKHRCYNHACSHLSAVLQSAAFSKLSSEAKRSLCERASKLGLLPGHLM